MAKFKITEATKKTFMEKIFYYIGKGIKPMVIRKMEKKSPKLKQAWNRLEKARDEFEKSIENL
tara:strand:- start:28 stop:216 length:189 start_codon:yes stop_codon:yes gene_type:complete